MANEQSIDEIVDPKAQKEWDNFIDSLGRGQDVMAESISMAIKLNKELGSSTGYKEFSKAANDAAIAMEKLRQERAKSKKMEEQALALEARNIEMAEKRAIAQGKAALAAERASAKIIATQEKESAAAKKLADETERAEKRKEDAKKRFEQTSKSASDSVEQEAGFIAQSEKDIARGLEASGAAAIVSANEIMKAEKEKRRVIESSTTAFDNYGISLEGSIRRLMQLQNELNHNKKAFKELGDSANGADMLEYERSNRELREAIRQTNLEIRRFTQFNLEAENSTDQLEAKLNILRGAYNKLSDEEKNTSEEARKLKAVVNELDEEWKKQKLSVGQTNVVVGDYKRALDGLPEPMVRIHTLLQGISNEEGKVTFKGIINGIKEMTAASLRFIATPIGAAIAALAAITYSAKAWYDYNVQLEKSTKLTKNLTDLTGDDLKAFRSEIQATADTFGDEFNEVIRSANTLAKEFGISYSEAIDLVNRGYVEGANSSNQMLDNIKEYSSQLSAAGMSAEEMVTFMVRAEKEGIFNDKAVDTVKEGTLRLREMTKATTEALAGIGLSGAQIQKELISGSKTSYQVIQEVTEKMQGFSQDSAAVGAVLADVFGGPGEDAGLRFLGMLKDINKEEAKTVDQMTDLERATYMQLQATEDLNKEIANLFDATGGEFELMIAQIKLIATDLLIKFIRGVVDLRNWFAELYNESMLFRGVMETIPAVFSTVYNSSMYLFNFIIDSIKMIGGVMKETITGSFDYGSVMDLYADRQIKNGLDHGKAIGDAWVNGFNNTLNGKLDMWSNTGLQTTDALNKPTTYRRKSTGGAGVQVIDQKAADKARKEELKRIADFEKRKIELQIATAEAEKANLEDVAKFSKRIIDDEENSYSDRFLFLTEYYDERQQIIEKQAEIERLQIKKSRIDAKQLLADGKKEEYNVLLQIIDQQEQEINTRVLRSNIELQDEIKEETKELLIERYGEENRLSIESFQLMVEERKRAQRRLYNEGAISEKEYNKIIKDIEQEANEEQIRLEISQLEKLIGLAKEKGIAVGSLEKQLAKMQIDLSNEVTDNELDNNEELMKQRKKAAKELKEIYKEMGAAAFDLFDNLLERRVQKFESEIELNEEEKQKELADLERSSLTEEQKRLKEFEINQRYDQKEEDLERKKVDAQKKQAKFQKAQAIMNIALFTAQGIARAFADYLFPVSTGIAIAVGALGAIQLAAAIAQPLPQYYTGTKSSKGGPAHVGERGTELFVTPSGELGFTPSKDTIMNLEEGTRIFNANETKRILDGNSVNGESFAVSQALKQVSLNNRELIEAYKNSRIHTTTITKRGWMKQSKKVSDFNKYIRSNNIK